MIIENNILKKINFSRENLFFFAIKIFLKFTERIFIITISIEDIIENFAAKIYCLLITKIIIKKVDIVDNIILFPLNNKKFLLKRFILFT
tara:strand:- start:21 stop:290 length:270 start_codon:yes stop_codon:yes gene_type:complete